MDGDAASKAEDDAHKVRSDAKKLPWEERLSHKVAMVRFDACEDISEAAGRALSPQDSVLDELADLLPKAVGDSNANVMDKGLEAAARVLEKGGEMHATRCAQGICKMVMSKCLTSRPATLKKVKEVLMLLVEQEQQATVINALVGDGFGHKVPKAVAAAANLALDIYTEFGARAVKPELALKAMPKLFESKDATSRDAAKRLTVVMAQWVGRASVESVLLEKMRDAMKKDVDVWLSNLPDEKPKAARLTRKAAAIQKAKEDAARKAAASGVQEGGAVREHGQAAASASIWAADDEEEDGARGVDKYDLADPVDILPQLKKDFWGGLSSSKWMDRRDALQSLKSLLTDNPKLESGVDYHDLNSELRKVITKDANVACVSEAIHCAGGLASGLRPSYKGAALQFAPLILDKFKEKNSSVVAACHASLIAMAAHCFHLVDISEDVVAALKHTNPKVKQETLKWLGEVIRSHDEAFAKKLHKGLLPTLVKSAEEPTPAIRDAAMVVLAELAAKAGSLAPLEKAIAGLDDAKKKKLTAMAQAAISGDAPPASPPPVSAPARVSSATTTCPPAARPSTASGRASNAR